MTTHTLRESYEVRRVEDCYEVETRDRWEMAAEDWRQLAALDEEEAARLAVEEVHRGYVGDFKVDVRSPGEDTWRRYTVYAWPQWVFEIEDAVKMSVSPEGEEVRHG